MTFYSVRSVIISHWERDMKSEHDDLQQLNRVLDSFIISKTIPSLSKLLEEPVKYVIKKTQTLSITNLNLLISDFEEINPMYAVYVKCNGDLHMGVLWYMLEDESRSLADKLIGNSISNKSEKLIISSISELGNMLTASIINAISDSTGYKMGSSVPGFAVESLRILLEATISDFSDQSDMLIASTVEFSGIISGIRLQMLLIQDSKETKKLIA